jgi:DNA-binding XRE family transcriptional regulator
MGEVIGFARHERASSSLRAAKSAKTSKVISRLPRSDANATTEAQRAGGMPRTLQLLTVESDCPRAPATAPVPPRVSMIESGLCMDDNIVRIARTSQGFAKSEMTCSQKYDWLGTMTDSDEIISARLKALRIALGYKHQNAFASELGIEKNTYNPFENGKRTLTFEVACRIRRRFGIHVDWLFFGDMGQVSNDILLKIGSDPSESTRPAKRRK